MSNSLFVRSIRSEPYILALSLSCSLLPALELVLELEYALFLDRAWQIFSSSSKHLPVRTKFHHRTWFSGEVVAVFQALSVVLYPSSFLCLSLLVLASEKRECNRSELTRLVWFRYIGSEQIHDRKIRQATQGKQHGISIGFACRSRNAFCLQIINLPFQQAFESSPPLSINTL